MLKAESHARLSAFNNLHLDTPHHFLYQRQQHLVNHLVIEAVLALEPTATLLTVQLCHQRLEVHNWVLVTEKAYHKSLLFFGYPVELLLLHELEALHYTLVDAELRGTVLTL